MKNIMLFFCFGVITVFACQSKKDNLSKNNIPVSLNGTWQLVTAKVIEKGDTLVTDYTKNISFIKIINATHFSFLQHDKNRGKDSAALFVAGGGRYTLNDSTYTEILEYCSSRNWEGNDFKFTVHIINDTLIQSGVEKVAGAGVDRINIEKYVHVKN